VRQLPSFAVTAACHGRVHFHFLLLSVSSCVRRLYGGGRWYPDTWLGKGRDMHDMDLTSGDGLTHLYYKGEVLWPFGASSLYAAAPV
jgi:hypothetical protein